MAVPKVKGSKEIEKLEYAVTLIETMNAKEASPIRILEVALMIMDFGNITSRQMMDFIEANGR